ncbi:MAG: hypothetical protein JRH20_13845 [Deltaproteobacteria bacterium]|nr:hypothetical protein [Deltaproteobacteria bacterium]
MSCVVRFVKHLAGMTRPMPVRPNTTYMESRRCSEGRLFLKPSKTSKQIYEYVLALAAQKYRVELHGFVAESNHDHVISTDTKGNHPAFRQLKNSLIARAMNVHLNHSRAFWASTDREVVELVDEGAQVEAYAYTLANPVKDGLVMYGYQWPGPRSQPRDFSRSRVIKRPHVFFSDKLPEEVMLTLTPPPCLAHMSVELAAHHLTEAVAAEETKHRQERAAAGLGFLGRRAVRKQHAFDRPTSEPGFHQLNPRIKCVDITLRKEAIEALKGFWKSYAFAREQHLRGHCAANFPEGTYAFRQGLDIPCAAT